MLVLVTLTIAFPNQELKDNLKSECDGRQICYPCFVAIFSG